VRKQAARVHAKLAMAKCPDGSLEIWPVTGSAVTSGTSGHGEEAFRIGKSARSTRGRAACQRYIKAKHARLVLGTPRSLG
jgi:L-serine deaminase